MWRKEMAAGLKTSDQLTELRTLCQHGIDRLNRSRFTGFVFDYDGTLCEPHERFEPLSTAIADGLNRLLRQGAIIGIATGRGGSAAGCSGLRSGKNFWDNIVIGLYNGAVICSLKDGSPQPSDPGAEISRLESMLSGRHGTFQAANSVQTGIKSRSRCHLSKSR